MTDNKRRRLEGRSSETTDTSTVVQPVPSII